MSDKIDVLAVMEEMAGKIWRNDDSDPILVLADEARTAIAKLIEAATVVEVADRDGWLDDDIVHSLRAALARLKGA